MMRWQQRTCSRHEACLSAGSQAEALATCIARDVSDDMSQCETLLRTYYEWVVPNWADGVIRGNFLRSNMDLSNKVSRVIDLARGRLRRMQDFRAARSKSAVAFARNPRLNWRPESHSFRLLHRPWILLQNPLCHQSRGDLPRSLGMLSYSGNAKAGDEVV